MTLSVYIDALISMFFPMINATAFFIVFVLRKKKVFFWVFVLFACLFINSMLRLSGLIFPNALYFRSIEGDYKYALALMSEACTLTRIYSFYKITWLLLDRSISNKEEMAWALLTVPMFASVFLRGGIFNHVRYYGVLFTYTLIIISIIKYGFLGLKKSRDSFSKFNYRALRVVYALTLFCYTASFIFSLLKLHEISLYFIKYILLFYCVYGFVWLLFEAYPDLFLKPPNKMKTEEPPAGFDQGVCHGSMDKLRKKYLLTDRETEIICLMLKGKTNEEMSKELWIALGTVKKHNHNIFRKMSVNSRKQVIDILENDLKLITQGKARKTGAF